MKRNKFGINMDEGIPLKTKEDFEILYIPSFKEVYDNLVEWFYNDEESIIVGGQIGTGKSSLINKLLLDNKFKPDIELFFDSEGLNLDHGDFWAILLEGFIKLAIKDNIDISFSPLPKELANLERNDWKSLLECLSPINFSIEAFNKKVQIRKKIGENEQYIKDTVRKIGELIENSYDRKLIILASGIDKFNRYSSAFYSIRDVISFIAQYKTLFEVNFIHLLKFYNNPFNEIRALHLTAFTMDEIKKLLNKRLGKYNEAYKEQVDKLAEYSGGNPRQAVRLLNYFLSAMKKQERTISESVVFAIHQTSSDFFSRQFKPSPEIIKTISKDKYIESSIMISGPEEKMATAAVYGNWVIIIDHLCGTKWNAKVNPLVKSVFLDSQIVEEPEIRMLKEYATNHKISPEGLSFVMTDDKTGKPKDTDILLFEYLSSGVEQPIHTNISDIFDMISSSLLSKNRADRIIITYKKPEVLKIILHYLIAKANTFEYQTYEEFIIDSEKDIVLQFEKMLSNGKKVDIYSVRFEGDLNKDQLEKIEKYREKLIDKQMIWWIHNDKIKDYLSNWTHLRQYFQIFDLDDKILNNIKTEDIMADIELYSKLIGKDDNNKSSETNIVRSLYIVLKYLVEAQNG